MTAPHFRRSGYNTKSNKLDAAYAAWAAHYNACACCQHEDWYTPDQDKLCPAGVALFYNWSKAAYSEF